MCHVHDDNKEARITKRYARGLTHEFTRSIIDGGRHQAERAFRNAQQTDEISVSGRSNRAQFAGLKAIELDAIGVT
jgi:hypothetical protein